MNRTERRINVINAIEEEIESGDFRQPFDLLLAGLQLCNIDLLLGGVTFFQLIFHGDGGGEPFFIPLAMIRAQSMNPRRLDEMKKFNLLQIPLGDVILKSSLILHHARVQLHESMNRRYFRNLLIFH